MASITCTSKEEPPCIAGYDHDWGKEKYNHQDVGGDLLYPGKYWICRHCLWTHTIKYSGMDEYRKNVQLDCSMDWPESPTLCVTCMEMPRAGGSARCLECDDKPHEPRVRRPTASVTHREFVDAEIASLGGDISALEKKYGISMETISAWVCLKTQSLLEYMLNSSKLIPNEHDRAEYINNIVNVKIGFYKLDAELSVYKSKCLTMKGVA